MDGRRRHGRAGGRGAELGATTIEHVGLAAAVAVLLATIAAGLGGARGTSIGDAVGARLTTATSGRTSPAPSQVQTQAQTNRREHTTRHERTGGAVRVSPPSSLEVRPVFDTRAAWQRRARWSGTSHGVRSRVSTRACVLCVALGWNHDLRTGATASSSGTRTGVDAKVRGEGRIALASAEAQADARREVGGFGALLAELRARATIGGDVEGRARLRVASSEQDLELRASALAGASARGEARVGVELLGVAVSQKATGEAWAGAGVRGVIGVHRSAARIAWRVGWGGALGLGGAAEWEGSVDVSKVPVRHRRLASGAMRAAVAATPLGLPLTTATTILRGTP